MATIHKALLEILDKIGGMPVTVIGDVMLDRYVWGAVERISPEAPVPIVAVSRIEDRLGGAGNAAANLAAVGAKVTICGLIGSDEEGQILRRLCEEKGIDSDGLVVEEGRPTTVKTRIIAHAQQVVRMDRETRNAPRPDVEKALEQVVFGAVDSSRAVLLSDYGKGVVNRELLAQLKKLKTQGKFALNDRPLVLDPNPANFDHYSGVTVAKPNRREAEEASGVKIADSAAVKRAGGVLLKRWDAEMMLISLGEDGLAIVPGDGSDPVFLQTMAQEVHDVSGAGDTVTALFAAALAAGAAPPLAGALANIGAGIVVSEVGTVAVSSDKLRREISRLLAGGAI